MIKIEDNGVTYVEIKGPTALAMAAISITQLLKAMPEMNAIVSELMAGNINLKDLGIIVQTKQLSSKEDTESAIRKLKEENPANDKDVPDFVKRAIKGEDNG